MAKSVVTQLAEHGKVDCGWLGVSTQPLTKELAQVFKRSDATGALVASVVEGSPAAKAGVKSGDVVVEFAAKKVTKSADLPSLVAEARVGSEVPIVAVGEGKERRVPPRSARVHSGERAK